MNPFYMLKTSNNLNTSNNIYYSENSKYITMSNQQVNKWNSLFIIINYFTSFICNLRDYTEGIIIQRWLRYSPVFIENMKFQNEDFILPLQRFRSHLVLKAGQRLNKILKKNLYIDHSLQKLDPNWITGFIDAEGCFSIIIEISDSLKWKVRASFEINLHEKDKEILYKIQAFFGIGAIYNRLDRKISVYRVTNINYIKDIIIPHFINYPLISRKQRDFLLWSKVIELIFNGKHLTKEGLLKILSYYASINRGVSKKVQKYFSNIIPINKPIISLPDNLNPQWVSGFVGGDGGFSIYVRSAKDYVLSEKVYCRFHIAQHVEDIKLMELFVKFFNCGLVSRRSNPRTPRCDFIVQDTNSLLEKILPHFDSYPLFNLKQKDYISFKECMTIIKFKQHLTQEGLKKIKNLNLEMNSNRFK